MSTPQDQKVEQEMEIETLSDDDLQSVSGGGPDDPVENSGAGTCYTNKKNPCENTGSGSCKPIAIQKR